MANIFTDPIASALGATLGGASVAVQGGTWVASEFAKIGKRFAGRPGEISAAVVGAGTGAIGGFLVGSVLGAISRGDVLNYFLSSAIQGLTLPGATRKVTEPQPGADN